MWRFLLRVIRCVSLCCSVFNFQNLNIQKVTNDVINLDDVQIIDEKSLIKKYQREISTLKEELDQLRRGMLVGVSHEEILTLKQKVLSHCAHTDLCIS